MRQPGDADLLPLPPKEQQRDLEEWIGHEGWYRTARLALRTRLRRIERDLATNNRLTLEDIRVRQAQHALLDDLLRDPVAFFQVDLDEWRKFRS